MQPPIGGDMEERQHHRGFLRKKRDDEAHERPDAILATAHERRGRHGGSDAHEKILARDEPRDGFDAGGPTAEPDRDQRPLPVSFDARESKRDSRKHPRKNAPKKDGLKMMTSTVRTEQRPVEFDRQDRQRAKDFEGRRPRVGDRTDDPVDAIGMIDAIGGDAFGEVPIVREETDVERVAKNPNESRDDDEKCERTLHDVSFSTDSNASENRSTSCVRV
jgi:hypothetical protein